MFARAGHLLNGLAVKVFLLAAAVSVAPTLSAAQDATTIGALTLTATFNCISVRASFTGDVNASNSATIQYRPAGTSSWSNAYPPIVDRRALVSGVANPHVNQVRGSIVGLTPGTNYEVRLTFLDLDGLVGGPSLAGAVDTIPKSPPLGGRTWYVDDVNAAGDGSSAKPFNTIPEALAAATPGDTVLVRRGTYPPFAVSKSGTPSAWIAVHGEDRDTTLISGGTASTNNVVISSDYVQVTNLRFKQAKNSSVQISSGRHHVWLDNLYHEDVSSSQHYDDAGVRALGGNHHIFILNQTILSPTATANRVEGYDAAVCGIAITGTQDPAGTWVIKGNIIVGGFRDGIGNSPESFGGSTRDNTDIAENRIYGCKDDGIQMEGDDTNLRIWGNDVTVPVTGNAAIATESSYVGPVYIFRNVLKGGTSFKVGGSVWTFYFHNTVDNQGASADVWAGTTATFGQVLRNNLVKTSGNPLYYMGTAGAGSYDYNLYLRAPSGNVVRWWNGTSTFVTLAAFASATGQETHGVEADPLFQDEGKRINLLSPAYEAGTILTNFNDAGSAWPYAGAAPEMGAFEVGGPPAAPLGVAIRQ